MCNLMSVEQQAGLSLKPKLELALVIKILLRAHFLEDIGLLSWSGGRCCCCPNTLLGEKERHRSADTQPGDFVRRLSVAMRGLKKTFFS